MPAIALLLANPMQELVAGLSRRVELPFIGSVPAGAAILGAGAALLAIGWYFLQRR